MSIRAWLGQYLTAAVTFLLLDLVWLTVVAQGLYADLLGDLLAEQPRPLAAAAFYALFVAGLVHFVTVPAVRAGSWRTAALGGAFFGLVTYATWDLTSLAVLAGFPALLVPVDLAWGAVLAGTVSAVTYAVARRVAWLRPAPSAPAPAPGP